jgi:hypothetical protein
VCRITPLARTQSERRRRLALATGFRLLRLSGINRIAAQGSVAGRGWADPDGARILTITGGSSMAAMTFKLPPQFGQCSMSMSKTRLSSLAQLRRALHVIACGRGCLLWRTGRFLYCDRVVPWLFTENETNNQRLFRTPNPSPYVKDGINNYLVNGQKDAVNPKKSGTKTAAHY